MKTNVKIGMLMLAVFVAFTSCKKEEKCDDEQDSQEIQTSSSDNALAENESANMDAMSSEAALGTASFITFSSDCVTIDRDTSSAIKVITIDFGPTNCLCQDGRYRRGKVIISIDGAGYFSEGSLITKTTENYFVNDNQIIGSKTVTNLGNFTHSILADWTIVKANGGGTITWVSERTRVQIGGFDTPDYIRDDVYEISGSANGVNAKGRNYTIEITNNLVKDMQCRWIKSGVISITIADRTASIDFGNGDCDDQAEVTRNGNTRTITLR